MSILDREILRTPYALIDVETTGLSPRDDRIVEIAVAVVKPGEAPELVLDTLVNPGRPMSSTDVHGITDADVLDAPSFSEIATHVAAAISNRVVAAHNASFDVSMLGAELERSGFMPEVPCVCTMLLARVVDPSTPRLTLESACQRAGVPLSSAHTAKDDALAAGLLLQRLLPALRAAGARTFADLRARSLRSYAFFDSFELHPLPPPPVIASARALRPRNATTSRRPRSPIAQYLEEVVDALADLDLSEAEVAALRARREQITLAEARAVHARVFWAMLSRYVEDARIDEVEVCRLRRLRELLETLGWTPGH